MPTLKKITGSNLSVLTLILVGPHDKLIATAMPPISNDFHLRSDIGWYGSAYRLTATSFILVFGRVYIYAIVGLLVGSAICGAAPSSLAFIIGPATACLGSADMFSEGMMTIVYYLNIRFQVVKGDSAIQPGISTIPVDLALIIMGILSASVTRRRIGYYRVGALAVEWRSIKTAGRKNPDPEVLAGNGSEVEMDRKLMQQPPGKEGAEIGAR